ncbi:MAG: phosphonate ABC transporter substrate-binding protein [Methylobacter sp.]|nr:MAG: phosphonate ABC transporter substrate-binding protein [Methylobacter sp.]
MMIETFLPNAHQRSVLLMVLARSILPALMGLFWLWQDPAQAADHIAKSAIRLGLLPDSSPEILNARFKPLKNYLEVTLERPVDITIPSDYNELVNQFGKKKLDIVFFGGVTFATARKLYHAEPLVMRDIDLKFTSLFLTQADNAKLTLADFKGTQFSFGAKLSTSGHYMPRYFLLEQGIVPEKFFNTIHYSGGHDKTALAVREGRVDIGVANGEVIRAMIKDGRLSLRDVRIVWETPFYTDYVFAVQPGMPKREKQALRDAFLALSISHPQQRGILSALNAQSFIPASNKDFEVLDNIIQNLEKNQNNGSTQ